ncbi:MAG: hypothetical protein CL670_09010 [Balneola sp.]|jgi:PAS domain S-box-containing protein|nr:hypothetical protein [Balneola sp.]MBE79278.1 hypothetical protein [Balneola sp.]|tara:strand:+ start:1929 stop:3797 length:1869 start_codon:yes stop_codon:yes gene_type:complete
MPAIDSAEKQRLETLLEYEILDTEESREFDNLVKLAAQICEVPIAKINFLDDKRTWSKANYGNDIKESPREMNFCHTTIKNDKFMVVEDATKDERFREFEFVAKDPKIRFYAGVNIKKNKQNLGTICVLGMEPKTLSEMQLNALHTIANEIEVRLELIKKNIELETTSTFLKASVDLMLIIDPETLKINKCIENGVKIFSSHLDSKDQEKSLTAFRGWPLVGQLQKYHTEGVDEFETETSLLLDDKELHLEINAIKKDGKWLITAKDITERVEAEMEVMREKLFTESIINSLPVNFFMYDENGDFIRRRESKSSVDGYPDDEFAKMSPLDFFSGDDVERVEEYIKKTMSQDEPLGGIEADLIRKDGEKEPHLFNAVCFNKNGKKYLVGTSQSIKAQRDYQKKLEKLLTEKEVLLAEVHHRVKNNLAVISGFLQMQEFMTDNVQAKSVLLSNHMRVKSMALIHEDLYKLGDFGGINFQEYLSNLLEFIDQKKKSKETNITLKTNISFLELNLNQAVPLALIIHELVSNAYEYAFQGRKNGTIEIDLIQQGEEVHLLIQDDGVGLPDGFVLENSPTLGATLVLTYSEQIKSEIKIESHPLKGTKYELIFENRKDRKGSSANMMV